MLSLRSQLLSAKAGASAAVSWQGQSAPVASPAGGLRPTRLGEEQSRDLNPGSLVPEPRHTLAWLPTTPSSLATVMQQRNSFSKVSADLRKWHTAHLGKHSGVRQREGAGKTLSPFCCSHRLYDKFGLLFFFPTENVKSLSANTFKGPSLHSTSSGRCINTTLGSCLPGAREVGMKILEK